MWAVAFDLDQRAVVGDPIPVFEGVRESTMGAGNFSLARDGSLLYVTAEAGAGLPRALVWVNREGREEDVALEPRPYDWVQVAPDGRQVLAQAGRDVWIYDLARNISEQFDSGATFASTPLWTPDSARVVFSSSRDGSEG